MEAAELVGLPPRLWSGRRSTGRSSRGLSRCNESPIRQLNGIHDTTSQHLSEVASGEARVLRRRPLVRAHNHAGMGELALVGRETELAELEAGLRSAVEHGAAFLITGPPGIGKTSLLNAVAAEALSRGYNTLAMTGLEGEAEFPYAGLHQLLQTVMASVDKLAPPQKAALLTALGITAGPAPDVFLVGLATLNLIDEAAADKPTVLLADDAQWLDGPTSAVLTFVARRLESTSILLLVGLRARFDSPLRNAGLTEVHVGPLDDASATALLDSIAPNLGRDVHRQILEQAVGHPLALVELPRALAEQAVQGAHSPLGALPLTERLERTFSARAATLPPDTQLALLLAALDDDPSVAEVVAATGIQAGGDVTADVLESALDSGLIALAGANIRFRHPLIRSALDQGATHGQRRAAHLALAQVMADPDRRAWHRAASVVGTDEAAATDLEATAARAQARGAIATALGALELAASLTPDGTARANRLLAAAELAFELGQPAVVGRLLDEAAKLELTSHDMARMTWLREIFYDRSPGTAETILKRVAVAEEMAAQGDRNLALELLQEAALRCRWAEPESEARARVVKAVEQLSGVEWTPKALTILSLAAPLDSGTRVSREVARAALVETTDGRRTQLLAFSAWAVGDIAPSIELMNRAADLLRVQGRLSLLAQVLTVRAWAGINTGSFSGATRDAEEGGRLAIETEQPIWVASSQIYRAILAGLRGEERAAEQGITEAAQPLMSLQLSRTLSEAEFARGVTAMTAGRNSDACDHFIRMFDPEQAMYHGIVFYAAACYVVEAAIRAGRHEDARRMMALLEALSKRTSATLIHAGVRYGRAVLAEDSRAEGLYELALKAEPKWPFHHARLQMSYGSWLRRQRRITESRPYLRTARDTFEALGVHAWADKARAELRASGERLAEPTKAPRQSLSPQELQIAQMAASGLSNREIGDRLFLSHRTVGAHLYRVFPKLGIASRSELSTALARLEPAFT